MGCRVGTGSHLPRLPSHLVSVKPFLRPWSRSRTSAKCSNIPFVFSVSEQLLQGFFSLLIYSLLFLKYTQRPLALGTSRSSSPSPKYTLTRLSGTWAKPAGIMGPGVRPSSHQEDPRTHLPPAYGPRDNLRAPEAGMFGRRSVFGRCPGGRTKPFHSSHA